MSIKISAPETRELKPKIVVFGVGGAGGNAVNNMINSNLEGVDFVVANTDAQALQQSLCDTKVQLGMHLTQGLGAGSKPDIGREAAEEAMDEIMSHLEACHMCFITAGMGGGTGTGAAPVVARAARDLGVLTVGVVTKPFQFEGSHRMRLAEDGIESLHSCVDTLIIIPNQNLFRIANEKTTFADAFAMADNVLRSGVAGVTDLMVKPGLINLDFADVNTVMSEMGKAMMGTGEATGDGRAIDAAEAAISNPLLDDVSMKGARGVLINITGGTDLALYEVDEAANRIRSEVDPEANIIVGSTFDTALDGTMRVSVVATGIDAEERHAQQPLAPSIIRLEPGASVQEEARHETPVERRSAVAADEAGAAMAQPTERQATPEVAAGTAQALTETAAAAPAAERTTAEPEAPRQETREDRPENCQEDLGFAGARAEKPISLARHAAERRASAGAENGGQATAFVPPQPAQPEGRGHFFRRATQFVSQTASQQAPSEDAEQASRNAPSLFERMTGGGARPDRMQPERTPRQAEAEPAMRRSDAGGGGDQASERHDPQLRAQAAPAQAGTPKAEPRRVSSLEATDRPAQPRYEDELLDIPAFLRRQAN